MVINQVGTATTTDEDPASEHSQPSVRVCKVDKSESGSCGFHLTRTKWDPYPWIAGVDDGSPAQAAGLQVGDCVLEVNGDDVLGQRVGQIAAKVVAAHECIAMLLWNAGSDANCDTEVSAISCIECRAKSFSAFGLRRSSVVPSTSDWFANVGLWAKKVFPVWLYENATTE